MILKTCLANNIYHSCLIIFYNLHFVDKTKIQYIFKKKKVIFYYYKVLNKVYFL